MDEIEIIIERCRRTALCPYFRVSTEKQSTSQQLTDLRLKLGTDIKFERIFNDQPDEQLCRTKRDDPHRPGWLEALEFARERQKYGLSKPIMVVANTDRLWSAYAQVTTMRTDAIEAGLEILSLEDDNLGRPVFYTDVTYERAAYDSVSKTSIHQPTTSKNVLKQRTKGLLNGEWDGRRSFGYDIQITDRETGVERERWHYATGTDASGNPTKWIITVNGQPPYATKTPPNHDRKTVIKRLIRDERRANVILDTLKLMKTKSLTKKQVAELWKQEIPDYPTPFSCAFVNNTLRNPVLMGRPICGKQGVMPWHEYDNRGFIRPIENLIRRKKLSWKHQESHWRQPPKPVHDTILTEEQFGDLQKWLDLHWDNTIRHTNHHHFIWKNIAKCSNCGSPMVRNSSYQGEDYLICKDRHVGFILHDSARRCKAPAHRMSIFDWAVSQHFKKVAETLEPIKENRETDLLRAACGFLEFQTDQNFDWNSITDPRQYYEEVYLPKVRAHHEGLLQKSQEQYNKEQTRYMQMLDDNVPAEMKKPVVDKLNELDAFIKKTKSELGQINHLRTLEDFQDRLVVLKNNLDNWDRSQPEEKQKLAEEQILRIFIEDGRVHVIPREQPLSEHTYDISEMPKKPRRSKSK